MGRFQWIPALRSARNSSLVAASSLGKLPRVLMILRRLRCRLSRALVTGMRISVPKFGGGSVGRGVWCVSAHLPPCSAIVSVR